MLYLLGMYSTHCFLVGSKTFQQKLCAFVDFCSVVSFHWSKMLNTHPIKVNEVSPKKYQLMLSRVCGAELDAKSCRCEDGDDRQVFVQSICVQKRDEIMTSSSSYSHLAQ